MMSPGDAILTSYVKDERNHGWLSYKAPKGTRFVLLLLGAADKDANSYDVDARLNELGWFYRDPASCDEHPKGENSRSEVEGQRPASAVPAEEQGDALPSDPIPSQGGKSI